MYLSLYEKQIITFLCKLFVKLNATLYYLVIRRNKYFTKI